jgi:hypothetical protein
VLKGDRFQYRFWFISTGKIGDQQRADAVTLCQQQHIQLFIFEEAQLEELYGPSLFCYPSFDNLDNLKDAIRQVKVLILVRFFDSAANFKDFISFNFVVTRSEFRRSNARQKLLEWYL